MEKSLIVSSFNSMEENLRSVKFALVKKDNKCEGTLVFRSSKV